MRVSGKPSFQADWNTLVKYENHTNILPAGGAGFFMFARSKRPVCRSEVGCVKRFSETGRWGEPWYRKLKPRYKSLFEYIWSTCDCAGVWTVDIDLAGYCVGEKLDAKEALVAFSGKVIDLSNGTWLIPEFIRCQCGRLSPSSPPHKKVLQCLASHSLAQNEANLAYSIGRLPDSLSDGLPRSPQEEEEEEEEDKEEEKDKGSPEGKPEPVLISQIDEMGLTIPEPLRTKEFLEMFNLWIPFRLKKEKPKDPKTMFQLQLSMLSEYSIPEAVEIVKASIRNNWQGLIRPEKMYGNGNHSKAGNGAYSQRPSPADERNRFIVGADETRRAIEQESERRKREPKPWDNLPGDAVSNG